MAYRRRRAPRAGGAGPCSCRSRWWSCWASRGAASGISPPARRETTLDGLARARGQGRAHPYLRSRRTSAAFRSASKCVASSRRPSCAAISRRVVLKAQELLAAVQVYDPTLLITRILRPADHRRAGPAAGLRRQLDARPIERARHARRRRSAPRSWSMAQPSTASARTATPRCSRRSGSNCTAASSQARRPAIR